MNCKRFFVASIVIFVVLTAADFAINNYVLQSTYRLPDLQNLWRPDAEMRSMMWIGLVTGLLSSLLFTYVFIKGYEAKGLMEGVRFGILMWLFIVVPVSHGYYIVLNKLPYSLCLQWCGWGLLEMLVAGLLAAAIYRPAAPKAA
jgi:hypothetical protein